MEASRRLLRLRLLDYAGACPVQSLHNSLPPGSECVGVCVDRVFKFLVFVFLVKKKNKNKAKIGGESSGGKKSARRAEVRAPPWSGR